MLIVKLWEMECAFGIEKTGRNTLGMRQQMAVGMLVRNNTTPNVGCETSRGGVECGVDFGFGEGCAWR